MAINLLINRILFVSFLYAYNNGCCGGDGGGVAKMMDVLITSIQIVNHLRIKIETFGHNMSIQQSPHLAEVKVKQQLLMCER